MDYIPGKKITELTPLRLMEIDGPGLARELFRAYLKQILLDGLVHADPHPGNVFLTDDDYIALVGSRHGDASVTHISAITFCACWSPSVKDVARKRPTFQFNMGEPKEGFKKSEYRHRVANWWRSIPTQISAVSMRGT